MRGGLHFANPNSESGILSLLSTQIGIRVFSLSSGFLYKFTFFGAQIHIALDWQNLWLGENFSHISLHLQFNDLAF